VRLALQLLSGGGSIGAGHERTDRRGSGAARSFELVALDSNLSIADRKISQLRKLRMDPCGNLVKPTDPDYAECAEVK
jgi:hypothetical protein